MKNKITTEIVEISRGVVAPNAGEALNSILNEIQLVGGVWFQEAKVAKGQREHRDLFLEGLMQSRPFIPGFGELTPEALKDHGDNLELFHVTAKYSRGIEWESPSSANDAGVPQQQPMSVAGDGQGEVPSDSESAGADASGEGNAG